MKRRVRMILMFKNCKPRYQVMASRKKLMERKNDLKELHFEEFLYLSDNICTENHNLFLRMVSVKKCQKNPCLLVVEQHKCVIDAYRSNIQDLS